MPTEKERITVNLSDEDYQWVVNQAEIAGNSQAGILRQMVRAVRLGRPGLLNFGDNELVFADDPSPTGNGGVTLEDEDDSDETEEDGIESFKTA
jgi:hypothetical protein